MSSLHLWSLLFQGLLGCFKATTYWEFTRCQACYNSPFLFILTVIVWIRFLCFFPSAEEDQRSQESVWGHTTGKWLAWKTQPRLYGLQAWTPSCCGPFGPACSDAFVFSILSVEALCPGCSFQRPPSGRMKDSEGRIQSWAWAPVALTGDSRRDQQR